MLPEPKMTFIKIHTNKGDKWVLCADRPAAELFPNSGFYGANSVLPDDLDEVIARIVEQQIENMMPNLLDRMRVPKLKFYTQGNLSIPNATNTYSTNWIAPSDGVLYMYITFTGSGGTSGKSFPILLNGRMVTTSCVYMSNGGKPSILGPTLILSKGDTIAIACYNNHTDASAILFFYQWDYSGVNSTAASIDSIDAVSINSVDNAAVDDALAQLPELVWPTK
jgi:hypothetical protein